MGNRRYILPVRAPNREKGLCIRHSLQHKCAGGRADAVLIVRAHLCDCVGNTGHAMFRAEAGAMFRSGRRTWVEELAQDLVEYSMLLGVIALVAAGLFLCAGGSVQGIWHSGDTQLTAANTAAGGDQASTDGGQHHGGNHAGEGRQND
jgi:Flp pilus assembly pilin Flp